MTAYVIKVSDDENIRKAASLQPFTHAGIYLFEDEISVDDPVFIYFGGDKAQVSWATGLAGLGKILKKPYDKGYDKSQKRYFKIDVQPLSILPKPIPIIEAKLHSKLSRLLYDVPYIGAKHFPTQAIQKIGSDEGKYATGELFLEWSPESENILKSLGMLDSAKILVATQNKNEPKLPVGDKDLNDVVLAFHSDATNASIKISSETVRRLIASLMTKRFVIISGLSGSGKTKLAHAFATWITPKSLPVDPFIPGSKIVSDRLTYYVNNSDTLSVEFWNNENSEEATKVTLPRAIINEWANYAKSSSLTRAIGAREFREGVSPNSKYSAQLHSFETHLKAAAFAQLESEHNTKSIVCYRIVSVGADWTSNENILGYHDALQPTIYRKPSSKALDLILQAHKNPDLPYFLILDEMNLSHVERYFADILSAIESEQMIALHAAAEPLESCKNDVLPVPSEIKLPDNLFIIGTVNIDETTYMFSPKVLDRANVIEFHTTADDIAEFLDAPARIEMAALAGKGATYGRAFVNACKTEVAIADLPPEICDGVSTALVLKEQLKELFEKMEPIGAEFGFRSAYEISRFIYHHAMITGPGWKFNDAIDAQIVQKLMPKLHGSKKKLGPVLDKLREFCEGRFPISEKKIVRMQNRLVEHGFTSYTEA